MGNRLAQHLDHQVTPAMHIAINTVVFLITLAGMEAFACYAHKYVMHGWGWGWHRSHHEPRVGWFETNDLYAVVFAGVAIVLIALGTAGWHPLEWVGAGMTAYGFLYFLAHDRSEERRVGKGGHIRGGKKQERET